MNRMPVDNQKLCFDVMTDQIACGEVTAGAASVFVKGEKV